MWLYGYELLTVGHHPAKFIGHGHCGKGDIVILVCHVILQDYLIKEPYDIMEGFPLGKSPSCQV